MTAKRLAILLFLLLYGCTSISVTPVYSVPGTSIPTRKPPTPTPLPTLTLAPGPAPTQELALPIEWIAPQNHIQILDDSIGLWSPTANEMVLDSCSKNGADIGLTKIAAPDFTPFPLTTDAVSCRTSGPYSLIWSPDGKQLLFAGPPSGKPQLEPYSSQVWAVDSDGRNARPVNPKGGDYRNLIFNGWMDGNTLITSDYWGVGLYLVQITDLEKNRNLASLNFYGKFYPPNPQYVPSLAMPENNVATTFVLAKKPQARSFDYLRSKFTRPYPADNQPGITQNTYFLDWLPGSNQMLVRVDNMTESKVQSSALSLWDLDNDATRTLLAGAINGKFSPDGKTLAYLSSEVINFHKRCGELHLLDFESNHESWQSPVQIEGDLDVPEIEHPQIAFSLDSRYLALLLPAGLSRPASSCEDVTEDQQLHYLQILDIKTQKRVWLAKSGSLAPSWSPKSDGLIYEDPDSDLLLWRPADNRLIGLVQGPENDHYDVAWSYDGSFIAAQYDDSESKNRLEIIKVD